MEDIVFMGQFFHLGDLSRVAFGTIWESSNKNES